ncbi:Helix-loop-helix DNA-binding protein [Cordyceps fumosorosea ARSEF 2679]|uniref:Helix-loop-helix DNA-binding protein n=1 Tax=Cordyceps fumosorosea (strain ARSEF 2679) TaxID=1081104 RepID=A0A167XEU5_CORFA|nr:Helix-loop-helix DNA-binding protein [Cordyceps fumosorosea ARSEF 2679]OAA64893.1 Helix-loop-helix DNA-binding protein [Cordyceps fumosorosea ARSEF 2679]
MPAAAAQRTANAAGLTNILNQDEPPVQSAPPPQLRDSGFYSTAEASSKHNSGASFNAAGLSPASGYQSSTADKTPSPVAANTVPHQQLSPASAANMSVAAMVSPTSSVGVDRRFERPTSHEFPGQLGDGLGAASNVRRESVDSRINQGISDMRLGGSPYTSNNQSTSSLTSTLHSQRNPRAGIDSYASHRISNGYQPSNDRNPESKTIRTAPAITGPATGTIARAAEPTKGQAWAFPEEEIKRVSHYDESRRSSVTDSIASSQFTTESRLPSGQRRLEDSSEYARMSGHSSEFPSVHHHTMQHKQLSDLQAEEGAGGPGAQPYSRTPELRVSHKLAERKRRTEMKELFDQLRDLMPQERGSKASKWEILTKAITEYQRQTDHIRVLQSHYNTAVSDNELLRRELQAVKMELSQVRGDHPPPASQAQTNAAPGHPFPPEQYPSSSGGTELPPLRSINNGMSNGPDSMTGVQYDGPRTNGYRERY